MEAKRGRGRPRKSSPISNTGENAFDSKQEIENAIDKTQFDFYEPTTQPTPEVNTFNPLTETPIERDYSTPKIQEGYTIDIEEPTFHQKTFDQIKNEAGAGAGAPAGGSPSSTSATSAGGSSDPMMNPNPALNQLDDKEKLLAAEQMVDAVLDTYETLKLWGSKLAQIKEQKVLDLINQRKIDANRRIPIDEYGNTVSIVEFVRNFNEQLPQAVKADPNFRKRVRPAMIRIFAKRGWGMTDEQLVGFAFIKDISITSATLYGMNKGVKDILKRMVEENKGNASAANQTPPPPPKPQPQPAEEFITPEDVEEITDEELAYQERMMEMVRQREQEAAQREQQQAEEAEGVEKMNITFDENPLRETTKREPPAPKVTETFIKGEELKD